MKKILIYVVLLIFFQPIVHAQITYTVVLNEVPDGSNLPLIGLINTAHGNQNSIHVGFINSNDRNLTGAQIGFINSVGRDMNGIQLAFINSTGNNQFGIQAGFINAIGGRMQGLQGGFINAVDQMEGFQVGFINATDRLKGFQVGFINAAERTRGSQIGFINSTSILSGLQLGFVNTVETVADGFPLGFLSFVQHGGYQAFEMSFNEMYPYNASFKIGMDKFYTFPMLSYNPNIQDTWAFGFGAGSIVPMNEEVYFNPELTSQSVLSKDYQQITSLGLNFGHSFTDQLDFLAGPSLVWNMSDNEPSFSIHQWDIDNSNRLLVGFRASLRYRFR